MSNENLLSLTYINDDIENVSDSEGDFSDLPDEILLGIFKYFSFCEMRKYATVCKRWYNLSWRGSLLHNVNIQGKNIPTNILEKILRSGVKKLKIKSCELRIPTGGVCFKDTRLDTIQALYIEVIQECGPFQTFLQNTLKSCLNLQELGLFSGRLDEKVFRIILDMKFLQILCIHYDTYKSSSNISKCVGKCAKFDGLSYLCFCVDYIFDIEFSLIETLIMSSPGLRFLIIYNSCNMPMDLLVSPTFFKQLSMLKHLEVLKLPHMNFTSTSDVLDTLKSIEWRTSFENLKKLSLYCTISDMYVSYEECVQLQQAFVENFLKPCLNIETLTLGDTPFNKELILQLSQMKKLKELRINTFVIDSSIQAPFEFEESIELGITTLKIEYFTDPYFSFQFLFLLLAHCPKVESLYLKKCRVTEETLKCIRGICHLQRLRLKILLDEDWDVVFSVFKDKKIIELSKSPEEEFEILLQEQAKIKFEK